MDFQKIREKPRTPACVENPGHACCDDCPVNPANGGTGCCDGECCVQGGA